MEPHSFPKKRVSPSFFLFGGPSRCKRGKLETFPLAGVYDGAPCVPLLLLLSLPLLEIAARFEDEEL